MWKGVPFILTANKLPSVMREPVKKSNEELYEWNERYDNYKALVTRCRVHYMKEPHRLFEKFPYTA